MHLELLGLLVLLLAGLVAFVAAMIAYTTWSLTHPPRRGYAWAVSRSAPGDPSEVVVPPGEAPLVFEAWTCAVRNGRVRLPVWDIPGRRSDGPVALILHGWGDSRVVMLSRLPALVPLCSRVVMVDLAGHGDATGICTLGFRESADLRELVGQISPAQPLLLVGFSFGAALAIQLGASLRSSAASPGSPPIRLAGVIAEAPYRFTRTPASNTLRLRGLPSTWNVRAALAIIARLFGQRGASASGGSADRAEIARSLSCPLLIVHGDMDAIVPLEDGRTIAQSAGQATLAVIAGGEHHNLWTDPGLASSVRAAVEPFVAALGGASGADTLG